MPTNITGRPLFFLIDRVGCAPETVSAILSRAELNFQDIAEEDSVVPLHHFVKAFEAIAGLSEDQAVAWDLGLVYPLEELGDLGPALSLAPTLGDALRCFERGFATVQTGAMVGLTLDGDKACFSYRILHQDIWPRNKDAELTLGLVTMLIRRFCGQDWRPESLGFEYAQNQGAEDIAHRVRCLPSYTEDTNSITFPAGLLDRKLHGRNRQDFMAIAAQLDRSVATVKKAQRISTRVKHAILLSMDSGHFDQTHVAKSLGMSRRTLRRRLVDEGLNFQALVDECRKNAAYAHLVRTDLPLSEVALKLGYSDQTAFSRAFCRWYGSSPRNFRTESREVVLGGNLST